MKTSTNRKMNKGIFAIGVMVIAVIAVIAGCAGYIIDYQWFKEVGYIEVFFKKIFTQLKFFVPAFILFFGIFVVYIKSIDGKKKGKNTKLTMVLAGVLALFLSVTFVGNIWYEFLVFMNKVDFNLVDPVFGRDIGFYIFSLPFLGKIVGMFSTILISFGFLTILYGFINMANEGQGPTQMEEMFRPQNGGVDLMNLIGTMAKQLSNLVALFFIAMAANFLLKNFNLLYSPTGVSYGAGYTDIKVLLPANYAYAAICIFTAITVLVGARKKNKKILLAGPVLLLVAFVVSGGAAGFVQGILVKPNEISKETKYIQNTIDYTNYSYGLDKVEVESFAVEQKLTREDIENNAETIQNIPVNDYKPALDIYNQIQGLKTYYNFNDMDIDRYMIDGEYRQVFLAARELVSDDIAGADRTSWINRYLKYTHGYGVAMSPVNEVTSSGQPKLILKDIPIVSDSNIQVTVPQIYYGELTTDYAIVNTKEAEFDYQTSNQIVETTYEGKGGIQLNLFNRILFAIKEGEMNFLLSQALTSDSKVLINRDIVKRVNKIAPFLEYDNDPYLVISEGKLYWILDAYTTSTRYPYAEPFGEGRVNYVKNSVKVVMDAYDGTTDFYIADSEDPLIMTYNNIYTTLFKPLDSMPADLRTHVRYSQTLFNIQADMYRKYHVKDARELYNKSDMWDIGTQIYGASSSDTVQVESAYMIMNLPDTPTEEFVLMIPYTPQGKNNMTAWMAVRNDGEEYGRLLLYEFSAGAAVEGPMQFENIINQDVAISNALNLLNTGGSSQVVRGNTLIIPVEQSLLYVEPIYIRSGNETALPELKKVIVYYKNRVVMEDSLDLALLKLFPKEGGATVETPSVTPVEPGVEGEIATFETLARKANELYIAADNAIKQGDWAAYGQKMKELETVLNRLNSLIVE